MLKDFRESFAPLLADADFQREFLSALYQEEGVEGILEGLREIAMASRSFPKIAERAGVSRTTLYRSLSSKGNPSFKTVQAALNALGLDLAVVSRETVTAVRGSANDGEAKNGEVTDSGLTDTSGSREPATHSVGKKRSPAAVRAGDLVKSPGRG